MRLGKRSKITLAVVGALLVVEAATYLLLAERAMPVAAVRSLRDYGLVRGRRFALVPRETWDAMSAAQQAALEAELKRHVQVIYHSHEEIPRSSLVTQSVTEQDFAHYEKWQRDGWVSPRILANRRRMLERGYKIRGYTDGAAIDWQLEWRAPFVMKSKASIWVSETGAEGRWDIYVWVLGWWVRVWNAGSYMA